MSDDIIEFGPQEGELVVVIVREVKQNGAYVDLEEYEGIEGFIFIGEIDTTNQCSKDLIVHESNDLLFPHYKDFTQPENLE